MPKYRITKSRFIDSEYIEATPSHPAVIELPVGTKIDAGLQPVDDEARAEAAKWRTGAAPAASAVAEAKPKPHFVTGSKAPNLSSAQAHGKAKRPADSEPI